MTRVTDQRSTAAHQVSEGDSRARRLSSAGVDVPTLCQGPTLEPANACRVCMVEMEGSRVLVPSCSRPAEEGMVISPSTERARHSRRLVMELLGSAVELDRAESRYDVG